MNDVRARVARCFLNVFPDLKSEQIATATAGSTDAWDSIAQVNLMSSIEEEFNIQFEIDAFEQLLSTTQSSATLREMHRMYEPKRT